MHNLLIATTDKVTAKEPSLREEGACLRPHRAGIVIQIPELSASGQLLVLDSVEFISLVRLKWDYNYL